MIWQYYMSIGGHLGRKSCRCIVHGYGHDEHDCQVTSGAAD